MACKNKKRHRKMNYATGGVLSNADVLALAAQSLNLVVPGLGTVVGAGIGVGNAILSQNRLNTNMIQDSDPYSFKLGGNMDIPLSSSATLIQGKPNVTDGNVRMVNGRVVRLDNDEVVAKNTVAGTYALSPNLLNPLTGNSLADDGKVIQRMKGRAEKMLEDNPNSEFSQNTIDLANYLFDQLVIENEKQLNLIDRLNMDVPDKLNRVQSYQGGGQIDPILSIPLPNYIELFDDRLTNRIAQLSDKSLELSNQYSPNPMGPLLSRLGIDARIALNKARNEWPAYIKDYLNKLGTYADKVGGSIKSGLNKGWEYFKENPGDVLQTIGAAGNFIGLGLEKERLQRVPLYQIPTNPYIAAAYQGMNAARNSAMGSYAYNQGVQQNIYANTLSGVNRALTDVQSRNIGMAQKVAGANTQIANQEIDLNTRNRAAQDQAIQTAFKQVSAYGDALNKRKMANVGMAYLAEGYGEVMDYLLKDVMDRLNKTKK